MKYDVYGVGNALVDVQAQVSDEVVSSTNFDKGIMTLVDDEQQQAVLQSLDGLPLNRCAGGSAANTIVGIADFGGKAAFCGKFASDDMGDFFRADMQKLGVAIEVPAATTGQTGTCAVLITPDAQRTMLTNLGVSATLTPDDIDEDELRQSKYLYIEGYLLMGPDTKAATYRAIELAQKHDVKIAFTASDPFLVNMLRDEIWELIKGPVDLLFCNEEEAKSLTGHTDVIECAHEIHKHATNVALTLGPNGSLIMHGGEAIPIEGVPSNAIDTTGAGDMYAGGLLYGITNGLEWKSAGHLASHAAARIVAQLGARMQRKFTSGEVAELLK
ncbi:MAG: sugar/nucleoside kinase (ribokinase family) [Pirellulaceae bacterium]|jgi:sugar/nucleoside kinase (ribokinase family)